MAASSQTSTVIGFDPSFRNTGWAVYDNGKIYTGTINTARTKPFGPLSDFHQVNILAKGVKWLIERYNPTQIFLELPHGSQSSSASKGQGIVYGVFGHYYDKVQCFTARQVKVHAVGTPLATKRQMIDSAFEKYPDAGWTLRKGKPLAKQEHIADAVWVLDLGLKTLSPVK